MNLSEHKWVLFLERVREIFQLPTTEEIFELEKGHGPWDSLRNIQLFVVLREITERELEVSKFLEVKEIRDCKVFFN